MIDQKPATIPPPPLVPQLEGATKQPSDFFQLAYNTLIDAKAVQDKHWKELPRLLDRQSRKLADMVAASIKTAMDASGIVEALEKASKDAAEALVLANKASENLGGISPRLDAHQIKIEGLQLELAALRLRLARLEGTHG